ncbi:MAG: hypothetical protein KF766_00550 [Rhodocyclaceae bacterium]|nr:hypothetical protein [Rhodocyclaceae bacterium]MCP5296062.1 hypothetical protein [Zoogloeaceae bacterium]
MSTAIDPVIAEHSANGGLWLPFALGIAAPIVTYRTLKIFDIEEMSAIFLIGALVFGACAAFSRKRLPRRSWSIATLIYLGVPIGTLVDVSVDSFLFDNDRNLFPFEIVLWWVIAAIPILIGLHISGKSEVGDSQ